MCMALMLCAFGFDVKAQSVVRAIEGEVAFTGVRASHNMIFDESRPGLGLAGELRYNFHSVPVDIGIQGRGQIWGRQSLSESASDEYKYAGEKLNYLSANVLLVSDYNFRRGQSVSMFIGAGVGVAFFEENSSLERAGYSLYVGNGKSRSFCFMPRVGAEFFNRLRLTLFYQFEDKANECFGLQVGLAIGGGMKK